MASTFNLSIYAGETRTLAVTVTDQDGAALDLTGADITYIANLPTPITKTVGSGITVTDAAGGEFEIAFTQADTVSYDKQTRAQHECKILTSGAEVLVAFTGALTISDSLVGTMS